jgi:hypothetical protein
MPAAALFPEFDRLPAPPRQRNDAVSLADALDRILHRGVSVQGNVTIGLADVDLLFLDLRLLLGSIDTIWPEGRPPVAPIRPRTAGAALDPALADGPLAPPPGPSAGVPGALAASAAGGAAYGPGAPTAALQPASSPAPPAALPDEPPGGLSAALLDPGQAIVPPPGPPTAKGSSTAEGLVRLVLTVVKLLHDVLERQAVRRMDAGRLTDTQIENVGTALAAQAEEIERLRRLFGLSNGDLTLDLNVPGGAL